MEKHVGLFVIPQNGNVLGIWTNLIPRFVGTQSSAACPRVGVLCNLIHRTEIGSPHERL